MFFIFHLPAIAFDNTYVSGTCVVCTMHTARNSVGLSGALAYRPDLLEHFLQKIHLNIK